MPTRRMDVNMQAVMVRLLNRETDASVFLVPFLLCFNPRQEIKGDLCNFGGKKTKFRLHSQFLGKIHRVSSKLRKTFNEANFQKNLKPLFVSAFAWTARARERQQNRDPLLKTLLHGAASGEKLHSVPLSQERMRLIGPEFVTLTFSLRFFTWRLPFLVWMCSYTLFYLFFSHFLD